MKTIEMRLSMRVLLLIALTLTTISGTAQPMSNRVNCDLIVGDWMGTYTYEGRGFPTESYTFRGAYDESGVVMIDFNFLESSEEDRHEGYWYCQDGVLTTALVNLSGAPILFQYRILELGPDHWRYQLITPIEEAPVFDADRMSPGSMTPQLLDEYPKSYFDRLLPPGIEP